MTVPRRYWLAAAVGLWLAHPLPAQEPPRLTVERGQVLPSPTQPSANQQLADVVADQLRHSGQLRHYTVDLAVRGNTVEVQGRVADQPQREEVLRIIQGVPGVEKVVDHLTLAGTGSSLTRVQASTPPPPLAEPPAMPALPPVPSTSPPAGQSSPTQSSPAPSSGGSNGNGSGEAPPGSNLPPEPLPIFAAPPPGGGPHDVGDPRMPPYAWPTYAPYNNYSRVAYPLAYPYNAWPYIGPVYPFPKIPLGWRSVKLEWQDGHWWFSKVATKYDWWRLRYW